ncbi:MAG: 2-oxo acid dehydrogenase subunit E2, partial [Chitinispirillia bacterium]
NGEIFNKQCIIRNVNKKSVGDVDKEIITAKKNTIGEKSYMASKTGQWVLTHLPKFLILFIFRILQKNHSLVKKLSGTVFITSVSMFSNVPGYIIPYIVGPKAVSFAIGSITKKPVVINNEIKIREIINITSIFNHDVVDGAPAARFINRLRRYIESDFRQLF